MTVTPFDARKNSSPTEVVAVSEPEVAVIVADPFATEVTRPEELTVATAASDEAHVTVWPVIAAPLASFKFETSVTVSPTDVCLAVDLLPLYNLKGSNVHPGILPPLEQSNLVNRTAQGCAFGSDKGILCRLQI